MRKLDKNLWVNEAELTLFGANFGNRMTVIRLNDGTLLIHSPTRINDLIVNKVKKLGEVRYIVTPNNFHGLYAEEWCNDFPEAKYYSAKEDHHEGHKLEILMGEIGDDEIEIVKMEGAPKVNEYALIHKETNTLILTDMAFNIQSNVSMWSKVFFKLNGALGKFGPSKLIKTMVSDPAALKVSIDRLLASDIKRIIVSHGDVVECEAMAILEEAYFWLSSAKPIESKNKLTFLRCG